METYANQKIVKTNKELCDKTHLYSTINLNALQKAMLDLNEKSLKLWLYLSKNQDGYVFALSATDSLEWGLGSRSSYKRAKKDLIDKGYLIETSPNHYDFYELPREQKDEIVVHKLNF